MDKTQKFKDLSNLIKLISPQKLKDCIFHGTSQKNFPIKIFDCTFPSSRGLQIYNKIRIQNACFLSFENFKSNEIIDSNNFTLGFPDKNQIFNFLKTNKIKKSDNIILYDQYGIYSSPRAWFILKAFKINNIYILDGGLPLWIKNNFPIEKSMIDVNPVKYHEYENVYNDHNEHNKTDGKGK